ncbi:Protein kinase-like domain [Phytophthora cactorum]|nr:Protein kinase-like domain [Phytophthora cactorum]
MTLIRNRYRQVRQLAQTTYGGIYLCNDEFLPINMLDLRSPELQAPDDPRQEKAFALLQRSEAAPHPNIVQYLDDFIEGHTLYFVLEYCAGGDLVSSVNRGQNRRLACADALAVVMQIATGVAYLHSHSIAHRDLSLENMMLSRDQPCFGRVGKAYYMAPEVVLSRDVYDSKAADVGKEDAAFRAFRKVGLREVLEAWHMDELLARSAMELLDGMLQCDPTKRLTIEQVLNHEAFDRRAIAA